jgi:hypothetical protein
MFNWFFGYYHIRLIDEKLKYIYVCIIEHNFITK